MAFAMATRKRQVTAAEAASVLDAAASLHAELADAQLRTMERVINNALHSLTCAQKHYEAAITHSGGLRQVKNVTEYEAARACARQAYDALVLRRGY